MKLEAGAPLDENLRPREAVRRAKNGEALTKVKRQRDQGRLTSGERIDKLVE